MSKRLFIRMMAGVAGLALMAGMATAQDSPKRGRKYKAPPVTTKVDVLVQRARDGKPLMNAAVIFHSTKDGKDDGYLEVKTDPEGKASIDIIPTGSHLQLQVIADGYATFGEDYELPEATKEILVEMRRPTEQYSIYRDENGKPRTSTPGVQEPVRPAVKPQPPKPGVLPVTPPATAEPQKTTPQSGAAPAANTPAANAPAGSTTTGQKPE